MSENTNPNAPETAVAEPKVSACSSCGKPKAPRTCGICGAALCKLCADNVDDSQEFGGFALMPQVPAELAHPSYCHSCFDLHVRPADTNYLEILERARNIAVFEKTQKKESRFIKRDQKTCQVDACADRRETLMRLAFMAAAAGFNGLIDVDLTYKKVRKQSYQTTVWSGTGIPAMISEHQLPRDRSIWDNPN